MTELEQSPILTSLKRTLAPVISRQKKSYSKSAFRSLTSDVDVSEFARRHGKQKEEVCDSLSSKEKRLIIKKEVDEIEDAADSVQLAVGIVKEEVNEVDNSEAEQHSFSLEMVKEELLEESEAEEVSCSAIAVSKVESSDETPEEGFPCAQCDMVFETAFVRWQHMGSAHQTSYRCFLCNQEFATKDLLRRHKLLERSYCKRRVVIPKSCPTCGKRYTVMRDYYRHVHERCPERPELTGVGRFPCSECGVVLHLERLLKAHRAVKHPQSICALD